MSNNPDLPSSRALSRNFRAFTDWLNVSPPGRDDPKTHVSDDYALLGPDLLAPSTAVSPRVTGNPCKPNTLHCVDDAVMFVASSPTSWDESPFVVKSDLCLKSSASSTPVFAISPWFSRRLVHFDSPKTFLDSVLTERDSEAPSSDWTCDDHDVSPIARTPLLLDVPKKCSTTRNPSPEHAGKDTQDICAQDRLDTSTDYWTILDSTSSDGSPSIHKERLTNFSYKRDAISTQHGSAPATPIHGTNNVVVKPPTLVGNSALISRNYVLADGTTQDNLQPAAKDSSIDSLKSSPTLSCSPLTPLSECSNNSPNSFDDLRKKRKRSLSLSPSRLVGLRKRARHAKLLQQPENEHHSPAISTSFMANPVSDLPSLIVYSQRTFPGSLDENIEYPLFYRQFPLSSYFQFEGKDSPLLFGAENPGGLYNPPRDMFDLYTPRFVKGKGCDKVGLCPICVESVGRGGSGKRIWLSMKFSAFNYHLQYMHGISAVSARPFSPPTQFRMTMRPRPTKTEKSEILEGKCHKCRKWIAVEGVKNVQVKVKELFWWKHAAICHQGSQLEGEKDFFIQDDVYNFLTKQA